MSAEKVIEFNRHQPPNKSGEDPIPVIEVYSDGSVIWTNKAGKRRRCDSLEMIGLAFFQFLEGEIPAKKLGKNAFRNSLTDHSAIETRIAKIESEPPDA